MRSREHLMLVILLYLLSVRYLSDAPNILFSPLLAFYCLTAMVGSLFPDVDWIIARIVPRFGHRNPLTHSSLIPFLLYMPLYTYTISRDILFIFYNAFTFGIATHLFGDLVKTGNLVWVKTRRYENLWYILNGIVLIVLLYLANFFKVLSP